MKSFRFQQFEIEQSNNVFRVGTDGVLLGALCTVDNKKNALEIGTGTGLISLMVAQRNPQLRITAIDINPDAHALSICNFEKSPFKERIQSWHCDFNTLERSLKFDLVFSNPPYFEPSESEKDKLARQTIALNFQQLIEGATQHLTDDGILSLVVPIETQQTIVESAKKQQLYLCRKVNIKGIIDGDVKRLILEFGKSEKPLITEELIIEKSPRQYSDHYLELTKEFHIFNKKAN